MKFPSANSDVLLYAAVRSAEGRLFTMPKPLHLNGGKALKAYEYAKHSVNFMCSHGKMALKQSERFLQKMKLKSTLTLREIKEDPINYISKWQAITGLLLVILRLCVVIRNQHAILRHWANSLTFPVLLGPLVTMCGCFWMLTKLNRKRHLVHLSVMLGILTSMVSLSCLTMFITALVFYAIDGQHLWLICDRQLNPYYRLALERANIDAQNATSSFDMDWCFGRAKAEEEFFVFVYACMNFFTLMAVLLASVGTWQVSREKKRYCVATDAFYIPFGMGSEKKCTTRVPLLENMEDSRVFYADY